MPSNPHLALQTVPGNAPFDAMLARRLAMRTESSAASCKAWAAILIYRLTQPRPMSDSGRAAGADVCRRMSDEARELIASADALGQLLGERRP